MEVKNAIELNSQAYQKKGENNSLAFQRQGKACPLSRLTLWNKSSTSLLHFTDN